MKFSTQAIESEDKIAPWRHVQVPAFEMLGMLKKQDEVSTRAFNKNTYKNRIKNMTQANQADTEVTMVIPINQKCARKTQNIGKMRKKEVAARYISHQL